MEAAERIGRAGPLLTPAERRVAAVVLDQPQLVAFGTVAELAGRAGSGAATVVRLASKLGFDGFSALQTSVQTDLARQLRPAAERIREPVGNGAVARHLRLESENVRTSLTGLDAALVADVVAHLADTTVRVAVLSGEASHGVAVQLLGDLGALRDGVTMIDGNDVAVRRSVALLRPRDVVIAIDLRRYDRWLVAVAADAAAAGSWLVAITDSRLSPLTSAARQTIVVGAAGGGPFDSHVGTLAVVNLLVAGVADRLRPDAAQRLQRMEQAWSQSGSLTDR